MCPLKYYTNMRQSKDPRYIRLEMISYARNHGIKPAARAFKPPFLILLGILFDRRLQLDHGPRCELLVLPFLINNGLEKNPIR
jgi:hypothetical protein